MTRCLVSGHQIAWRSNAKDLWSPSQNIEGIKFTHWCALISTPQARIQWKVSCNDTSCRSHLLAHFTFPNKTIWIPTWRHTNSMKLIRQARLAKGTNIMGLYGFAKPKNTYQLIYSSSMFQPKPFPKSLRQFLFILGFHRNGRHSAHQRSASWLVSAVAFCTNLHTPLVNLYYDAADPHPGAMPRETHGDAMARGFVLWKGCVHLDVQRYRPIL